MTHQEKLAKAKAKLMLEHPYIGAIATSLEIVADPQKLTFGSDGVRLTYNPDYFEKVEMEEILFALANGAMHTLLKHADRMHQRVGRLWQVATDITVNSMLVKNGFVLPPYAYYEPRFERMYAEEIYDILTEEMTYNDTLDESEAPTPEETASSDTTEPNTPTPPTPESTATTPLSPTESATVDKEEIAEVMEYLEQIFTKYKRQGELPEGLERVVPELFVHTIDWRERLYRYIADYAKSSYSFMPPNMKYLYRGICLPALSSDLLRIVIAIDTSGSVDASMLGHFLSEVSAIMQQYPNYEIDIITADAKIQSHHTYLPGEPLEYQLSGGGGTDFRPLFAYIEKTIDYPTLLLYFTDGMGHFPTEAPHYDVVWVMPEAKEVPFGECVVIYLS